VLTAEESTDVRLPADTALEPLAPDASVAEAEAAEASDESVEVGVDDAGTNDTPLAITAPPPAEAVEEAPDESVEEAPDESVDDPESELSVEDDESADVVVEPDVSVPLLLPLLFTAAIVRVQVLTSCTSWPPSIGVRLITHVCVMSPAGVDVVDWVITVVVLPSDWRLMTTGAAFAGERARKRHWRKKRKARCLGRRENMAGESERAV